MVSLTTLKGIGEKTELMFNKLGINSVQELLEYYPRDYDIYKEPISIASLSSGNVEAVYATVASRVDVLRNGSRTIIKTTLRDSTGELPVTWFNMPFLKNTLRLNEKYVFRGIYKNVRGKTIMTQPEVFSLEDYENKLNYMQPIYSLTKGVSNKTILSAVKKAIGSQSHFAEYLPEWIMNQYNLTSYDQALRSIHFPKDIDSLKQSKTRLAFDEFLLFQLGVLQLRDKKNVTPNYYIMHKSKEVDELIVRLPYKLTNAQTKVIDEIVSDIGSQIAMNRLIQGDVGSGKTIVAAIAMLLAVKNGYQTTIMAPTEVLAKQHLVSLRETYETFDVKVDILVGSMTAREKKIVYERLKNGEIDVIVGTHAIIQEKVEFKNLALVITDEQHRFGVRQRETLTNKGLNPHILVMSATPIPRSLAIIMYGDLDISIIDELPPNRQKVKNCVVNTGYRPTAYKFIQGEIDQGRQAYIVCSMVEQSDEIEAEAVVEYVDELRDRFDSSVVMEYLHGKMKPKEKTEIMERFARNEIHILVSTTVIEVGVNVPNATVMMVENAERFGLAQLHQLRGRVGRGQHQSYCILINCKESDKTNERLQVLNQSNDGFYIAEEDLRLRGPGDFFGTRQSGQIEFKVGDMLSDVTILKKANEVAKKIIKEDMELNKPENSGLKDKVLLFLQKNSSGINL